MGNIDTKVKTLNSLEELKVVKENITAVIVNTNAECVDLERIKVTQCENFFLISKFDLIKIKSFMKEAGCELAFISKERTETQVRLSYTDYHKLNNVSAKCGFWFKIVKEDKPITLLGKNASDANYWKQIPVQLQNKIRTWADYYGHEIYAEENLIVYKTYPIIEIPNHAYQQICAELAELGVTKLPPPYEITEVKKKLFFDFCVLKSGKVRCVAANHKSQLTIDLLHEVNVFEMTIEKQLKSIK